MIFLSKLELCGVYIYIYTGELGYDGPLYDGLLHMMDDMLGLS